MTKVSLNPRYILLTWFKWVFSTPIMAARMLGENDIQWDNSSWTWMDGAFKIH